MKVSEIKKVIKKIVYFTVKELKDKGLISLYLVGTIINEDRTPYSDIDLFGIVSPSFDIIKEENKINAKFKKLRKTLCKGFETRFRGIGIDELEGNKPRGVLAKYIGLDSLIKKLPFYKRVWGKKIDFSKFPINPIRLKEEAKRNIRSIERFMKEFRQGKEIFPMQNFSKSILYLARVEAEKYYGFKFDVSYKKLAKHLAHERNHIVHKAMELRYKKATRKNLLKFFEDVEKYLKYLKKRIKEWD